MSQNDISSQTDWTIGADPASDFWINHPDVSRRHCQLVRTTDGYVLKDLGSTNGTFVNGTRIDSSPVSPTDKIQLAGRVPLPWPDRTQSHQIISIGFGSDCDFRIDDKSVSRHHAELFVDPNGRWIVRDLESTNGTWVGQESIRATALEPTDSFRCGIVTTTPQKILKHIGGSRTFDSKWVHPTRVLAIMSAAAITLLLGLLVLRQRSSEPDAESTASTAIVNPGSIHSDGTAAVNEAHATPSLADVKPTQTPESNEQPQSVTAAQTSKSVPDRPSMSASERVIDSLFVIVDRHGNKQVSVATAWAASPNLLVTNGHVVESIDKFDYDVSAIHLSSGTEFKVLQFGYHPKYLNYRDQLAQSVTEIKRLQQDLTESEQTEAETKRVVELIRQGKVNAHLLSQSLDTFDAGWLKIDNHPADFTAIPMRTESVEPSKSLQLANPYLEANSAIFAAEDRTTADLVRLTASKQPIVDRDKSTPIRWAAQFTSTSTNWRDYHFAGCPVVSLRGRLVGMCCGFARKISSNQAVASNDNGRTDTVDIVPFPVIKQMIEPVIEQMIQNRSKRENQ